MIVARFIGGLGVGVSTIAAPIYIAEISPAESRGKLTALFQFNIVFGVLCSLLSNLLLKDVGPNAWRWMLGVEAFPALAFTALCPFLVESPRWLAMKQVESCRCRKDGENSALQLQLETPTQTFFSRANLVWFFAALITFVFPIAAEAVPAWMIFAFFGVMMVFHFLWALFVVPETKGRELT